MVVKCWNILPREMLDGSSLQVFTFRLDRGLTNLIKLMYLFVEGARLGVLWRSLPTQIVLWYYNSRIIRSGPSRDEAQFKCKLLSSEKFCSKQNTCMNKLVLRIPPSCAKISESTTCNSSFDRHWVQASNLNCSLQLDWDPADHKYLWLCL